MNVEFFIVEIQNNRCKIAVHFQTSNMTGRLILNLATMNNAQRVHYKQLVHSSAGDWITDTKNMNAGTTTIG
jgi:hypothetical protein